MKEGTKGTKAIIIGRIPQATLKARVMRAKRVKKEGPLTFRPFEGLKGLIGSKGGE